MCQTSNIKAGRGVFIGTVVRNDSLCFEHFTLTVRLAAFPPTQAGQFVQLQCRGMDEQVAAREVAWPGRGASLAGGLPTATQAELVNREPTLRRPLSLAGRRDMPDGSVELDIIYRTIGAGTKWLSVLKAGGAVSILGPLGNGFTIRRDKPFAALIGGGVGIPPMLYLATELNAAGRAAAAFAGARSAGMLPLTLIDGAEPAADGTPTQCVREFAAVCTDTSVATDDGSLGFAGLVSEAFVRWLKEHDFAPEDVVVYCCGPEPMERAIADICQMRRIECQVSLERHMACGIGTCQSCIVKIRNANPPGWSFKLCCSDGPVFNAEDVLW